MKIEVVKTVWNNIAFINDVDTNQIFAFVKKHPAVCTQADNINDAKAKIDKYFKTYINGGMV